MNDTTPPLSWVEHRAAKAVDAAAGGAYSHDFLRDLISDVMHLAASVGVDPFSEVDVAVRNYRAECTDRGDGYNVDGDLLEVTE